MKIAWVVMVIAMAFIGCAQRPMIQSKTLDMNLPSPALRDSAGQPRLILNAYPRTGFAPMRVTFTAQLENVAASDTAYLCLQEEWDYGDGAVSAQQLDCTAGTGGRFNTEFLAEHVYDEGGTYSIVLLLGNDLIRSNRITVKVVDSN